MFSSAELIEFLRKRARKSLRPERPPGEFPPGWQAWFAAMGERLGAITGASAEAIVAVFAQRELVAPPRRVGDLNRWQSFATLWRQQWQPPEPEDRRARLTAYAVTLLIHLLLGVALLWLAYMRFTGLPAGPQGDDIVQVEFIGEGTPQEQGGGPPTGDITAPVEAASPPASAANETAAVPAPTELAVTPAPPQPVASAPPSEPTPSQAPAQPEPAPAGAQPLQVTEVPTPDTSFSLPPPTPRSIELPQATITVPELQVPTRVVEIVKLPSPVAPAITPPEVVAPQINRRAPKIAVREAPTALPQVRLRTQAPPRPALATPTLRAPAPQASAPAIPSPTPGTSPVVAASPATGTTAAAAAASGNTPTGTAPTSGGAPAARSGTQPAATASGAGPAVTPKPGARPTPQRGDDWGASTRNRPGGRPGGKPGLFNADGSPRLPPGTAAPGGGLPPGTIEQGIADLDRAGSWLKRPPYGYTPTRFDRFWRPNETLLQEWVRKSIKTVLIPIPGTGKKIRCEIVLLALGGGCGITDPNLNDQEATARSPPDIPFKPELQEDQDSLRTP